MITDSRTGEYITADRAESGVYTWEIRNPLYFKILQHHSRPFLTQHDIIKSNPIQPQPAESPGTSQVFSNFQNLDGLTPSDWDFLERLQNPGP
uniref:Replication enhancer n=1 Tax=Tomato leaf curl New Delhi virus TaxID=223347 RepID=A0A7T6ZK19_9GEMI|nr:AC2 [Tomato leaf curl New Delhi virus]